MSEQDAFSRAREESVERGRDLEALRRDLQAMVREEVRRAGIPQGRLEAMVASMAREAVARERQRAAPASTARPRWLAPALMAVGLAAGVGLGAAGYARWGGGAEGVAASSVDAGADPVAEATADRGGSALPEARPSADGGAAPVPAPTPAARAARYDSLWDARSERFGALLARLEAAGPAPPVAAALATWRAGGTLEPAAARRLHDALVQLSLNEAADAGLVLDGFVTRGPCRGNSCGALLELWRTRGEALGMPPLPADPARVDEALGVAERALVLSRLEAA